jgi:hypothetical protein
MLWDCYGDAAIRAWATRIVDHDTRGLETQ